MLNFWKNRTSLEKILIWLLLAAIFFAIYFKLDCNCYVIGCDGEGPRGIEIEQNPATYDKI